MFCSLAQGVPKEAKLSYKNQSGRTKLSFKNKKHQPIPNKQGDVTTTYGNQKESTHF